MRIVSTDPNEFGFIAIGQLAWGFIAIGQMARGVFVLGQLAVGVAGAGQCICCIWGVGQVGMGVAWFSGMIGVAGRGFGGVLRMVPGLDPPRLEPPAVSYGEAVAVGGGHVRLQVVEDGYGPALADGGMVLPVKLTPAVAGALQANSARVPEVFAHLRREGQHVVCDELVEVPGLRSTVGSMGLLAARAMGMMVLGIIWWFVFATAVLGDGTPKLTWPG